MRRFDFYVYVDLLGLFMASALILFALSWTNTLVLQLEKLIGGIQDWGLIANYAIQMIPEALLPMIPFAAFLSAAILASRMLRRWEFAIFEFAGANQYRLTLPFIVFGFCIAASVAAISHYLLPVCRSNIVDLDRVAAENISFIRFAEGQFFFPKSGAAAFIGSISDDGLAEKVFVHDRVSYDKVSAYFSESARIVKDDFKPHILMENGRILNLDKDAKTLSNTKFDAIRLGIGIIADSSKIIAPSVRNLTTLDLLGANAEYLRKSGIQRTSVQAEIHSRVAVSLLSIFLPLLGMATIYSHRRLGLNNAVSWVLSIAYFALIYITYTYAISLAHRNAEEVAIVYIPAVMSLGMSALLLFAAWKKRLLGKVWQIAVVGK